MVLYKQTAEGKIPMTAQEEAEIRADWAKDKDTVKPKTVNERLSELEARLDKLEGKK